MTIIAKRAASLLVALALALLLSLAGFWLLVSPWAFQHVHPSAAWVFNTVPATAAYILGQRDSDHFLGAVLKPCDFCLPQDHLINYLLLAVPSHAAAVIGIAFLFRVARSRWRTSSPVV
jgi:hypothetical protein